MPEVTIHYRDSPADDWQPYVGSGELLAALLDQRYLAVVVDKSAPTSTTQALRYLRDFLAQTQGLTTLAQFANALGVDRTTLYRTFRRQSQPSSKLTNAAIALAKQSGYVAVVEALQRHTNPQATQAARYERRAREGKP